MLTELVSAAQGIKTAKDIILGMKGAYDAAKINEVKSALLSPLVDAGQALLTAQEHEAALKQRISELEGQLKSFVDWEAEKSRYELQDTGQGTLAYRRKEGVEPLEPVHWICPACYQGGKKSILKNETLPVGRTRTLECHPCGLSIVTNGIRHEPQPRPPVRPRR